MTSPASPLSPAETRLVRRLQVQQRRWPQLRWAALLFSVGATATGVYVAMRALETLRDTALSFSTSSSAVEQSFNGSAVFLACFATKNAVLGELLAYAGIILTGRVLAHWRGNPVHSLLLTLVAHQGASHTASTGPA